jgi:DNA-binding NarL/FixJ family response regulator
MHVTEMLRGHRRSNGLTPREREVARLVARGLSNKQVARELGLSSGTVKLHLHRTFQKLGVKGRSSLWGQEPMLSTEER